VIDDLAHLHGDMVADHLLGHPGPNGIDAIDLPAGVVDVRIGSERGDDTSDVEGVHSGDVLDDDAGQLGGLH
jgi:hypothetical protein